jgi:membrane fusion protein (multidrug efflux system)
MPDLKRRLRLHHWRRSITAATLACTALGGLLTVSASAQVPVGVIEANQAPWQTKLQAIGSLRAVQEVRVATELAGRVERIAFESGDRVNAGAVLVQLDNRSERAELQDLEAQLNLARLDLERFQRLVQQNSASQANVDGAQSRHAQIEARIAGQRTLIDKKTIRAPFAGRLGIRQINLGQVVAPGTEIVSLQASDPIFADFPLPQNALSQVSVGQAIAVMVDAYPKLVFPGVVAAIDARVDSNSRAVTVRGQLDNGDALLAPGMFVGVEVTLADQRQFITLPSSAIIYSPFGDNVYVVEEADGGKLVAKRLAIQTGRRRGDQVAIERGLSGGEQVVVAGQINLRDGVPVTIDDRVEPFNDPVVTAPAN